MKRIIVYGSHYGTTQSYAERLSELTGIPAVRCDQVQSLAEYGGAVHLGGLYAGGVVDLKHTLRALGPNTALTVVTVGLADVGRQENVSHIRQSLQRQMPDGLYQRSAYFHLRGGIDYAKLNLRHRAMMALLYRSLQGKPPEQRTAEDRELMAAYGKKMDFVDFDALLPIADTLRQPSEERFFKNPLTLP